MKKRIAYIFISVSVLLLLLVGVLSIDRMSWESEVSTQALLLRRAFLDLSSTAQSIPVVVDSLAAKSADSFADPWGHLFLMDVDTNAWVVSLQCLGKDGAWGGDGINRDLEWSFRYRDATGSWVSSTSLYAAVWLSEPFVEGAH